MAVSTFTPKESTVMETGIRTIDQPGWAPPGGTSTNRWREVRAPLEAAFLAGLRERIAQLGDAAWIKEHNGGDSVYIGWTDDKDGGYYVGAGLEHNPYLSDAAQRWFLWLQYRTEDGVFDERIGQIWIDAPYSRDTELHLDLMVAWLQAHRRTLFQGRKES